MKLQYIFYVLGIIFLFATTTYFAYEYIVDMGRVVQTILLVLVTIVFFFVADWMEGRDI